MKVSCSSSSVDRLSELPESLVFHIFSYLPMTDVVKTTILSNHWKNLWTSTPFLSFRGFKLETDTDLHRVRNFINRTLICWRGVRIQRFIIDLPKRFNELTYIDTASDIDFCLHFVMKYEIERLGVYLRSDPTQETQQRLYWAPQCLYLCSSLKTLYLHGCSLNIPIKNVTWNHLEHLGIQACHGLKTLYLHGCSLNIPIKNVTWNHLEHLGIQACHGVISGDLIERVLFGSPKLVTFVLYHVEANRNLSIESSSLRCLNIYKYLSSATDKPSVDTELRISTPKLQFLNIGGVPYSKCVMKNVPYLLRANLSFLGPKYYLHHLFSGTGFVGKTLSYILPRIKHVPRVTLSDWCIKAIADMKKKNMVSPFPKVEELNLDGCFEEYEQIVRLLEIFPEVKKLVLQQEKGSKEYDHGNQHQHGHKELVEFEAALPNTFLQKLRTIVITWAEAEGEELILPFIENLLKYASKLKKMIFRVKESAPLSNSLFLALLRMPRSSPTAELVFTTIPSY